MLPIDDEIGKSFAPALQTGDRARVGGLANRLVLAPAFSSNPKDVVSAGRAAVSFRKEDKFGASPIWDALDQAVEQLEPEKGVRAIILVTDGRATGNMKGIVPVADRAVFAGVVVHVLSESRPMIIRQSPTMAARIRPNLPLEQVARVTGGTIVPEDSAADDRAAGAWANHQEVRGGSPRDVHARHRAERSAGQSSPRPSDA